MSDQSKKNPSSSKGDDATARSTPKVEWDDSKMRSTYANVVNAASAREEISVFFGTNQTWNLDEKRQVTVQLSDRIILNPFAAKRLWVLLGAVLKAHEQRFGTLAIDEENRVPEVIVGANKSN